MISEDPIRDGLNWYTYCGNNPVGYWDPSGLAMVWIREYALSFGAGVYWDPYERAAMILYKQQPIYFYNSQNLVLNGKMYVDSDLLDSIFGWNNTSSGRSFGGRSGGGRSFGGDSGDGIRFSVVVPYAPSIPGTSIGGGSSGRGGSSGTGGRFSGGGSERSFGGRSGNDAHRGGQPIFQNGQLFESSIISSGIEIKGLADVQISGGKLTLSDIVMYPVGGSAANQVGAGPIMDWLNNVKSLAKRQGFTQLEVSFTRVTNSSSANPGHGAVYNFDLK